ncbi:MAG: ASKHA domain-containing protein [Oscillospiraceae bacterium]|nr:ASKHA domain-containing protein [Oscillospiraceae bacterium]
MKIQIKILPDGRTVTAETGEKLLPVLRRAGLSPDAPCGGQGTCGKCRVIIDGQTVPACQAIVSQDMAVVTLPPQPKAEILSDSWGTVEQAAPIKQGPLLAFDIGTTTVVCYLLDGKTGEELACASMLNPQSAYGADVVTRIHAALRGALADLTAVLRAGMTGLIQTVCRRVGIRPEEIAVVSVVGNPCMQQLFLGISPKNLAAVPFSPVLTKAETRAARDCLPVCANAVLLIVPAISGYVGADTIGCVLSTRMYEAEETVLMIDIGTNGELVLGSSRQMAACAAAAGPALEGANIRFGMRGAEGAIDHVWLEDGGIQCSVIGGGKAAGICGSGLIDAAAALLDAGLLNRRGRLLTDEMLDGQRTVRLAGEIYLTQDDIRQLQLAKGAIAAGIELLAAQLGIGLEGIGKVLLAGAFGSYLRPESACRIGLLPPVLLGKISVAGNAAGGGAKMLACSGRELRRAQELAERITFIELAEQPGFQRAFARNMGFDAAF